MVEKTIRKDGSIKFKSCPNPIGHINKDGNIYNVSCKGWKCPHCSYVHKFRIIQRFEKRKLDAPYRMLTLTEWKHPDNYENSKKLMQHWARLRSSLLKHGYNLNHYLWTKEYKPLKSEEKSLVPLLYPHLHVLVPYNIPHKLLSHLWYLATGETADQVHIPTDEEIEKIKNPVAYLTKYLTKSDMHTGFREKERRYQFSKDMSPWREETVIEFEDDDGTLVRKVFTPYDLKKKKIEVEFIDINTMQTKKIIRWRSENVFHLGAPSAKDLPIPLTGISPKIPEKEIIRYPKPMRWFGLHKYTIAYLNYLSRGDYIQVDRSGEFYKELLEHLKDKFKVGDHYIDYVKRMVYLHNFKNDSSRPR